MPKLKSKAKSAKPAPRAAKLNDNETKVLAAIVKMKEVNISEDLASKVWPPASWKGKKNRANSWTRNALRRLRRYGLVKKVGRGDYTVTGKKLEDVKLSSLPKPKKPVKRTPKKDTKKTSKKELRTRRKAVPKRLAAEWSHVEEMTRQPRSPSPWARPSRQRRRPRRGSKTKVVEATSAASLTRAKDATKAEVSKLAVLDVDEFADNDPAIDEPALD